MMENKTLVLAITAGSLMLCSSGLEFAWADAGQGSVDSIQIKATDAIKNDPGMMKILYNIELFKQKYAALQQKQDMQTQQNKMVDEQRKIANDYLQADLASANHLNDMSTPVNAYGVFVSRVDSSAQGVFMDEFTYMQQKIAQGKAAMNTVLQNGGSRDQALNAYYSTAATQKTELVNVNKAINVKYHLADGTVQDLFDKYGNLKKYSAY